MSNSSAADNPQVALYFTVMVIAVNLLIDIAYGWLDPRVRVS